MTDILLLLTESMRIGSPVRICGNYILHNKEKVFRVNAVYPLEDAVRGGQDESMKVAFEAYSKQDYAKAIPILENLVAKMPDKHDLKMYLGSSYLKSGAVGQAIREFEKLTAIETYSEQAKWYLALCYLKANENDRVTTLLEDIIVFDGIYRNDAKNLYEEILMQSNPDDF